MDYQPWEIKILEWFVGRIAAPIALYPLIAILLFIIWANNGFTWYDKEPQS